METRDYFTSWFKPFAACFGGPDKSLTTLRTRHTRAEPIELRLRVRERTRFAGGRCGLWRRAQLLQQTRVLAERKAFATYLAPLYKIDWYVDLRRPFAGPEAMLANLSRYAHRVAISNRRLIALDHGHARAGGAPMMAPAARRELGGGLRQRNAM